MKKPVRIGSNDRVVEYVTAMIGDQLFGLPIARVQDVFLPDRLARVPLAAPEIAGLLNMRGRIVTVIDMRRRLGMPGESSGPSARLAIGIEYRGESYGLLIDAVCEVLKLSGDSLEPNPVNLEAGLARVSMGVHRVPGRLLVILDIDCVLDIATQAEAA